MTFHFTKRPFLNTCLLSLFFLVLSFNSFSQQPVGPLKKMTPAITQTGTWLVYENTEGAFKVKFPSQPEEIKNEVANPSQPDYPPFLIKMYVASDEVAAINYLVKYNDYPAGMFLANKLMVFEALVKQLEEKGKIVGTPKVICKDGYEGRAIDVIIEGGYMEAQVYVRGNRVYLLLRQNMKGTEVAKYDGFFDSFQFEKYVPYKGVVFSHEKFNVAMPEQPIVSPRVKTEDEVNSSFMKDNRSYYAVNRNSGGVYSIEFGLMSKYFRIKNMDSVYKNILTKIKSANDSLYKSEDFIDGTTKGRVCYFANSLSGTDRKVKIWINNNHFYYQTAVSSREEISSPVVDEFFNSLKAGATDKTFNMALSKAALILTDLKSKDSTVYKEALGALNYYVFEKEDLPVIHTALGIKYEDDTSSYGVRNRLIGRLENLHDEHTVPLLKSLYQDKKNPDFLRGAVLTEIPRLDKNSYDWYLDALVESAPLSLNEYWQLTDPLRDSLSYTSKHIDKLLQLLNFDAYRPNILGLFSGMISEKDNAGYLQLLESKNQQISSKALQDVNQYVADIANAREGNASLIYRYLHILPKINLPKLTDEFTSKIMPLDSLDYLQTSALATRIIAGLPVDQKLLSARLDSMDTRYDIMDAYNQVGKLESLPLKYRKHDEFAKLLFYNYLTEDSGDPDTLYLLGSVKDGAKVYYVFSFSFPPDEDEDVSKDRKEFIGISGPFDGKVEKLDFEAYKSHSAFGLKEADWAAQAKALILEMNENE